ncbi:hypothetical protein K1719_023700 [Acacia pycnantha]|nr:hypothetical protein K1719_023700 [Acacia pycnantha]
MTQRVFRGRSAAILNPNLHGHVWRDEDTKWILIGKVLAKKTYKRAAIEAILRKAWNLPEGFDVIDINGNVFMFNFKDEEEYNRVLRGRPWSINGFLLNLMEHSKYKTCEEFDFSRSHVWIQMLNVPIEALCLENNVTIGGHVGEDMMVEDPIHNGKYVRGFMRARVLIDLRKPLAHGFWMDKPDGEKAWISIRYEKLQNYCYNCGKIGHDNRSCRSEQLMSMFDPKEPRFGAWLTTNMCRNRDELTEIIHKDWAESRVVQKKKEDAMKRRKDEGSIKEEAVENRVRTEQNIQGFKAPVIKPNRQVSDLEAVEDNGQQKEACGIKKMTSRKKSLAPVAKDRSQVEEDSGHMQEKLDDLKDESMAMVVYNERSWVMLRFDKVPYGKERKKNMTGEDMDLEEMRQNPVEDNGESTSFVFKAGGNRRKRSDVGGVGG